MSDRDGFGIGQPDGQPLEPKVDKRTRAYREAREAERVASASSQARESEAQARGAREQESQEHARQVTAAVGNQNDKRLQMFSEIADNLDATEGRKMDEFDGENVVAPDPTELAAKKAEEEAEAARQRLEAEANERAAKEEQEAGVVHAEPKKFKIKVNGRELELTEEQLLERAQKVESADEYLQAAAKSVEQARALGPSQDGSASHLEEVTEDTLTSALQGDKEAIKKIAQRLKAPSAVTPDVLSAVDDRMSFRSAVDWFRSEYKDITSDPMLYRLAVDEDSRLAQDKTLSYRERLTKAGESVRAWKAGLVKSVTPPNPKLERKASVAPVPQASARQSTKPEEDEEDEPIESVIDKMARSRHQNGAIR